MQTYDTAFEVRENGEGGDCALCDNLESQITLENDLMVDGVKEESRDDDTYNANAKCTLFMRLVFG